LVSHSPFPDLFPTKGPPPTKPAVNFGGEVGHSSSAESLQGCGRKHLYLSHNQWNCILRFLPAIASAPQFDAKKHRMIGFLGLARTCFVLALVFLCSLCSATSFEPIQIMCEINGFLIPAIIDTGAEITVMSSSCANRCRISQKIDTQYAGHAIGMGSSEILGAIDDLYFKIGPLDFQNKISILRDSKCDFLIGLDVLRRFKCDISIGERVLKMDVRGNTIRIPLVTGDSDSASTDTEQGVQRVSRRRSKAFRAKAARPTVARTRAPSFAPSTTDDRVSAAAGVYGGYMSFRDMEEESEEESEEEHERDGSISMEGF
jgi:hypothetical protein